MRSFKTLALAGGMAMVAAGAARAADFSPPHHPSIAPPAPIVISEASGWYLRGDVGVGVQSMKNFNYQGAPLPGLSIGAKSMETPTVFGVGVGYQFNSWLRFDVTGQYRSRIGFRVNDGFRNTFTPAAGTNCFGAPVGVGVAYIDCVNDGGNTLNGSLSAFVAMFNAYVDLGTWRGVTPYVGAGVGLANMRVGTITDQGFSRTAGNFTVGGVGPFNDGGPYGAAFGVFRSRAQTNLAWALHAGVSYDVTQNFKVDLGYSYLHLGDASSGSLSCFGGGCQPITARLRTIDSHDFKLGVRWMLGDNTYAAAPPPSGPLIRKY